MRQIITLALLLTCLSVSAQETQERTSQRDANRNFTGILSISSINPGVISVSVDGRRFNSQGNDNEIIVTNLTPGYHDIVVYNSRRNANNNGRRAGVFNGRDILYRSEVYVKPNYIIDIVINRFGRAYMDEAPANSYTGYNNYPYYYNHNSPYGQQGGGNYPGNGGGYGYPQGGYFNQGMDNNAFFQLKELIKKEAFDDNRIGIAKQAISRNSISSQQVKELLPLLTFEDKKLDLAKYAYAYCSDPENYFILNDAFTFSRSKEELRKLMSE